MASDLITAIVTACVSGVTVCVFLATVVLCIYAVMLAGQVIYNIFERYRERRESRGK